MPQESFSTAQILTSHTFFQTAQLQNLEAEGTEIQVHCLMTLSELDVPPQCWPFSHTGYDSFFPLHFNKVFIQR